MTSKNKGGKYRRRQRRFNPRFVGLVLSLALLISGAIGGTVAYLITETGNVANTFEPAGVPITVSDKMIENDTKKTDVKVTNNGNVDAYIRIALVATWQDKDGIVYPGTPTINTDPKTGWVARDDGYYYYTEPVKPGESTPAAFEPISVPSGAPDGCHLVIDVLAESIQAKGVDGSDSAAKIAWGYTPSGN